MTQYLLQGKLAEDVRHHASLAAAITAIGAAPRDLILPEGWAETLSANLALPANIGIIPAGGVLTLAAGVTLTVRGRVHPIRRKWLELPVDNAAAAWPQLTAWVDGLHGDGFLPEWVGAVGDFSRATWSGTDSWLALTKAVQLVERNWIGCLDLGSNPYYASKPIYFLGGWVLRGIGGAGVSWSHLSSGPAPGGVFPALGADCVFNMGGGVDHGVARSWAVRGLTCHGGREVTDSGNFAKCFVKVTEGFNGPNSPILFTECDLGFFAQGMVTTTSVAIPHTGTWLMERCNVRECGGYAFNVTTGAINNLRIVGGHWRANAGIRVASPASLSGFATVRDLLMESTPDPIMLTLGLCHLDIGTLYIEANPGTAVATISATNADSSVRMAPPANTGSSIPYDLSADNLRVIAPDLLPGRVKVGPNGVKNRSRIRGGFKVDDSLTFFGASLDPQDYLFTLPPSGIGASVRAARSTSTVESPWGQMLIDTFTGMSGYQGPYTLAVTAGQWLVFTIPMRYRDALTASSSPGLWVDARNQTPASLGSVELFSISRFDGDWVLAVVGFKAALAATSITFRLNPYNAGSGAGTGTGCEVGTVSIYTLTPGGAGVDDYIRPYPRNAL